MACAAQRHDAFMHLCVGLAAGVAAGVLRQLDALPLPLAALFIALPGAVAIILAGAFWSPWIAALLAVITKAPEQEGR